MKSLREKKEELVKEWETCFETKFDKKFNEKGKNKFWDDETDFDEAKDMLTAAGMDNLVNDFLDGIILGVGSMLTNKKNRQKMFAVLNIDEKFIYSKKFSSYEEAEKFIKEKCYKSTYTRDDFDIFEEKEDD